MNAQLARIIEDFESAEKRLQLLWRRLSPDAWNRRPGPERWSPIECVAHLNLTGASILPRLRDGLEQARRLGKHSPARYRRDVWGWLIWRALKTPGKFKTTTPAFFVPHTDRPAAEILMEFERLQADQIACVRDADGLPIDRITITSPFNERVKYSVYSALTILPAHQHRHLWQAEQAGQPE